MGQITLFFTSTQVDRTFSDIEFVLQPGTNNVLISNDLVTEIPESFMFNQVDLQKVVLSSGITTILSNAFKGCINLGEFLIGDFSTISDSVFEGCTKLTSITLPENTTTLSNSLFKGCTSLTTVHYSELATSFGNNVFENCTSLQSFTINENVTTIGNNVFKNTGLQNLIVPDKVTNIGESSFENCSYLTSFTIGSSITSLSNNLFKNCIALTNIYIPLSITTIGSSSFKNSGLVNLTVPLGVTTISSNAFESCTALTSIIISHNVITIGSSAFLNCSNLTEIEIPKGLSLLNQHLFSGCTKLNTVFIPNTIVSIKNNVFDGCSSIYNITIPDSVTTIEDEVFNNCINLQSIRLHSNVVSVGSNAFKNCSSMKNATILSNSTVLSTNAFTGCSSLVKAYINYPSDNTNVMLQYFQTNYQNVTVYFIPFNIPVTIEIPITLQLETDVETYAEIMHSDDYDFLLEEQKVLDSYNTNKVTIITKDILSASLRYLQDYDETIFLLSNSQDTLASLTKSIDNCNVEDRFMLTENKLLNSAHLTDNTITYPNAVAAPKIFSLTEHFISFLASAFFKNPENRGPFSNILNIKEQMKNGIDNNTIGQQFLSQVDPEKNPLVLRSIFEQMLAQDPERFTSIDDTIIDPYDRNGELTDGIPIPFKENDKITFNLKVLGNIKTQNSVYNNLYAVPNIKNIKDVFASFPWAQNYYQTSNSDNILRIIPKTFKVQCTVGAALATLNDMPYVDSNKTLYISPTSTDYVYDPTVEKLDYDSTSTTVWTDWKDNTTFVADPAAKSTSDDTSTTSTVKLLSLTARDYVTETKLWKRFPKPSDMLKYVTMYLTMFCTIFDVLKNVSADDMNQYVDAIYNSEKSKGRNIDKKDIIKLNVCDLVNLVKGIVVDIRKTINVIINVKMSTVKKLIKCVQILASVISRMGNTILDIMGFDLISEDNTQFLGSAFTLNYLLETSKKKNDADKFSYMNSYAERYGIVYATLLKIKLYMDVTTELVALEPEDSSSSSGIKPFFFPDPAAISKDVKNLINSAKSLKGKKNFPLFMNILQFACNVISLTATILTPSEFDLKDFLKLIQFNRIENFYSNVIARFPTIIDNGILKITGNIIGDTFNEVTSTSTDIINAIKVEMSDILDDISDVESTFTNAVNILDQPFLTVGETFVNAFDTLDTELTNLVLVADVTAVPTIVISSINNTTKKIGKKLRKLL